MTLNTIAADLKKLYLQRGALPVALRVERLKRLKKAIQEKEEAIHEALMTDFQKPKFESYLTEVGFILDEIGHVLKHLEGWAKPRKVKTPINLFPATSYIYPEAYGVVLIISPWNYPFQLCLSPFIGAIAAGNRVVLKPSEYAAQTSTIVKEIMESVFSEDEVFVVEGGVEETQTLLKQQYDYIFFTGSTPVGKIIMKAAAEHLTPVTLELGGKSPLIIEESANLDLAAKRTAWGKFMNAGQTCVAPDYVLIPKKLQDEFIGKLQKHLASFYQGNFKTSPDYPRVINEKHFDRLISLVDTEKVAIGGESSREEKFIAPTVLKDVSWTDKIMEDEIFGPLLPIIPYEDLNEVVQKIVERPKPLAFYLFTENQKMKDDILNKIPFGGGCVNETILHLANPYLPFGGVGASGMGGYHGVKSFETFTHFKSVLAQNTKVDNPLRYPPYSGKLAWLKKFLG